VNQLAVTILTRMLLPEWHVEDTLKLKPEALGRLWPDHLRRLAPGPGEEWHGGDRGESRAPSAFGGWSIGTGAEIEKNETLAACNCPNVQLLVKGAAVRCGHFSRALALERLTTRSSVVGAEEVVMT
jgi:hypothetical protein